MQAIKHAPRLGRLLASDWVGGSTFDDACARIGGLHNRSSAFHWLDESIGRSAAIVCQQGSERERRDRFDLGASRASHTTLAPAASHHPTRTGRTEGCWDDRIQAPIDRMRVANDAMRRPCAPQAARRIESRRLFLVFVWPATGAKGKCHVDR